MNEKKKLVNPTTIRVSKVTKDRLKKLQQNREWFDDILNRLIEEHEKNARKN